MFKPKFSILNLITNSLTSIELARGFFGTTTLSPDWIATMQGQTLIREVVIENRFIAHIFSKLSF